MRLPHHTHRTLPWVQPTLLGRQLQCLGSRTPPQPAATQCLAAAAPEAPRQRGAGDRRARERQAPAPAGAKPGQRAGGGGKPGQSGRRTPDLAGRALTKRQKERAATDSPQRLAKVIAQAGIASRRKAEELVASGVVKVNGKLVTLPQHPVLPSVDEVTVRGKPVPRAAQRFYFALNKPKGFLCASAGAPGRERPRLVTDLFAVWLDRVWRPRHPHPAAVPPRLFTVGRLDVQTTGLLFVTNDGEWAQRVQHPSQNLTKEYVVTLAAAPTAAQLEAVAAGSVVDGAFVQPKLVGFAASDRRDKLRVIVAEGRNREVRTLVANAGLTVKALKRVRVGGFRLPSDLAVGEFRELKGAQLRRVTDRGLELNPQANPSAAALL